VRLLRLLFLLTRLLALLHFLLLLNVFLLQLLRLPLMLLFHLLLSCVVRPLLRLPLMILLLPLLQPLVVPFLLLLQLLLLLLIFLIQPGVASVWSGRTFMLRNISRMHDVVRTVPAVVFGAVWIVHRSALSGRRSAPASKIPGSFGSRYRRPAMIL
jgi:hypothetical protein